MLLSRSLWYAPARSRHSRLSNAIVLRSYTPALAPATIIAYSPETYQRHSQLTPILSGVAKRTRLVACQRMVWTQVSCFCDNVGIWHRRLYHQDIRSFIRISYLALSGTGNSALNFLMRELANAPRLSLPILVLQEAIDSTSCFQKKVQNQLLLGTAHRAKLRISRCMPSTRLGYRSHSL